MMTLVGCQFKNFLGYEWSQEKNMTARFDFALIYPEVPFLSYRYKKIWPIHTTSKFGQFGSLVVTLLQKNLPHLVCRRVAWMVLTQEWIEEIYYRVYNSVDLDMIMWSHYAHERTLRDMVETIWESGMTYDELVEKYHNRRIHPTGAMLLETRLLLP